MADTYTALLAEITDWALPGGEPKFDAALPSFIRFAESRFDRELRVHNMIGISTITTDEGYVGVPTDWLETIQIAPQGGKPLKSLTIHQRQELEGLTGTPCGYAMIDGGYRLMPAPGAESTWEITYYRKLERLSVANQSNWLLDQAPDLYLHASLSFAHAYLDNPSQVELWANSAGGAIEKMNERSREQEYARGRPLVRELTFG